MKRQIPGIGAAAQSEGNVPDGVYLVCVDRARYRWHAQKPFYLLRLFILEPHELAGRMISGGLYCSAKTMWKLGWFLRDFVYDADLFRRDEVDEKALAGLRGIVKISHTTVNGICLTNLDGFAPASQREELSTTARQKPGSEVA
jgi:hypothetical protein